MKLVREGSRPISGDSGLRDIQRLAESNQFSPVADSHRDDYQCISILDAYVEHLLGYIDPASFKPLKLVVNAGNGVAGHVIDALEACFHALHIPVTFVKIHHQPDGAFPNGIPNPLLPANRATTSDAVKRYGADMGIAWDGDFDRCFLFDEKGQFIEGYYIVGLLAESFLSKNPGEKIIHDPRLTWNTIDIVTESSGLPVQSKTGHAFIKERMRSENAIYGGEMSAHHYFRDFAYCDSGMIPWLLVAELLCTREMPLSKMVDNRIALFPVSGEINSTLTNPKSAIERVLSFYQSDALSIDKTDGVSIEFANWRFNVRCSNTEPLVRLNVESRGDHSLMQEKTAEVLSLLRSEQGSAVPPSQDVVPGFLAGEKA